MFQARSASFFVGPTLTLSAAVQAMFVLHWIDEVAEMEPLANWKAPAEIDEVSAQHDATVVA